MGDVNHPAVGQVEQSLDAFIVGEVDIGIHSPHFDNFAAAIRITKDELGVVPSMTALNRQMTAPHPDRLIDQGRGAGP